jgi:hypothetical protein
MKKFLIAALIALAVVAVSAFGFAVLIVGLMPH